LKSLAIVGAGLSGLTLANSLNNYCEITLFEKSRAVGGRLATRRVNEFSFDHGAQYFTAKSDEFQLFVNQLVKAGCVERWDAKFIEIEKSKISNSWQWDSHYPHYVGVPSMNEIGKYLSKNLNIKNNIRIRSIEKKSNKWVIYSDSGLAIGAYDWVVIAIPAPQAYELLPQSISLKKHIKAIEMTGCYSLMLGFHNTPQINFNVALIRGTDISWISVNSSKPHRNEPFSLLIHSTNLWADKNLDMREEYVIGHMYEQVKDILRLETSEAYYKNLHKWRYANAPKRTAKNPYLIDDKKCIALCGDWLIRGNVEAAFTSGFKLAKKILESELLI
tara:strand:- start:2960 stop:3955 length:996 start_codon:yes stop_codon:yes gene_type:complete